MTNARCLTEGVDVPAIDCVAFADPKQSRIDIVQAAGRALRRYSGKDYGYILLPIVVPRGMDFEEFAETTAFRQVVRIIAALSTQDERIVDEFRAIQRGRIPTGKIVEIGGDVPVGMHMSLSQFAEAISTRIWNSVGRVNFRTFEDARAFVRDLGLKSYGEWNDYCASGRKPPDIPSNASRVYANSGWAGIGDWLGTGRVANREREFLSFTEARAFVHKLGLKSGDDWRDYCNSGRRLSDIPSNPDDVYEQSGWISWGDWLGTRSRRGGWQPFRKARAFVRGLNLKSNPEWRDYCGSGKRPVDIPANPDSVYADSGWISWGDWLGTGTVYKGDWRPFKKARAFARGLGLKSQAEWNDHWRSQRRPDDIPAYPNEIYVDDGWAGWGDWLGTGRVANQQREFQSFKRARAFVRSLGLKSFDKWRDYCKSGKRPPDIPAWPPDTYAESGWAGWGDWLGTGRVSNRQREFRSFSEARAFVRGLGLKSETEWRIFRKSRSKPADIPSNPNRMYADSGWAGMGDWLGTGRVAAPRRRESEARTVV